MRPVDVAIVGAGFRGIDTYANYIKQHPHLGRVVAVADTNAARRERAQALLGLRGEQLYNSWEDMLSRTRLADVVIIATQDRLHYAPTMAALEKGYHILLEKPMSPDPLECLAIADAAEKAGVVFALGHVLRYTPFFTVLKELVDAGRIGRLASIQWNENIGWWHVVHSYVRGNWRNASEAGPMILAKCCHDTDLLAWFAGHPQKVASFGSLMHFRPDSAPAGATARCTDGCPHEPTCPYSAIRLYLSKTGNWPVTVVTTDTTPEGILQALREGPYGRCAFQCDNDVVDHQVANIEFAGGITCTFSMCGFTRENARSIKFMGSDGEIRGHFGKQELILTQFATGATQTIQLKEQTGHGGGDGELIRSFLLQVREGNAAEGLTAAKASLEGHLLAFAMEEARTTGQVVDMHEYENRLRHSNVI